jgi:putative membrane protein
MIIYLVLALVFAVFVALFAVQNAGQITVNFLAWKWNTSVAVIILGAAAFGAIFGGLMAVIREIQLKLKLRGAEGRANRLETLLEEAQQEKERLETSLAEAGPTDAQGEEEPLR